MPETFNRYGRYIGPLYETDDEIAVEFFGDLIEELHALKSDAEKIRNAPDGKFIAIDGLPTYREIEDRERFDGRPNLLATLFFLLIAVCIAVVVGSAAKYWL